MLTPTERGAGLGHSLCSLVGKVDPCPKLVLLRNPPTWKVPSQPHRGDPRKKEKQ